MRCDWIHAEPSCFDSVESFVISGPGRVAVTEAHLES